MDRGDWQLVNPDTDAKDAFIDECGMDAFGLWPLGVRDGHGPETKEHWAFPYGDYPYGDHSNVDYLGLLAAEERARQYHYEPVPLRTSTSMKGCARPRWNF